MDALHQADVAGDADRLAAGERLDERQGPAIGAEEQFGLCVGRGLFTAVDSGKAAGPGVVIQEEPATADARRLRLDHGQREHHRHHGVGCTAPVAQDLLAGLGGARIGGGYHAPVGKDGLGDEKGDQPDEFADHDTHPRAPD